MLRRGRAKRGKHLRQKKLKLNNNNNNNNNKFNTRMVSKEREKIDNYCDFQTKMLRDSPYLVCLNCR